MPLRFRCPACGGTLQGPDAMAGQTGACTFCHARIVAPTVSGGIATLAAPGSPGASVAPSVAVPADMPVALDYAPFGKRVIGFMVDFALLWVLSLVAAPLFVMLNPWEMPDLGGLLTALTSLQAEGASPDWDYTLPSPYVLALSIGVNLFWNAILHWLYFALFESSAAQATPGKMLAGMRVTDSRGRRIGFGRTTTRTMAKGLSSLMCFIGYLMAAFSEKRQALHDVLAQTVVLNR